MSRDFDVIVIGGGPAGYVAAIKAAQLGAKTAIVEKDELGGTCLNRGCIPTKNYLKSAELVYELAEAGSRGIKIADPSVSVDMPEVVKAKNKVVKKLTGGVGSLLKSNGVSIFKGEGVLRGNLEVEIDGSQKISGGAVILAGGSRVSRIPVPGIESSLVMTSDEILDMKEVPARLAVIGGGVIGIEMAMIFNAFGANVTVVELADRILPFMDRELSETVLQSCRKKGIDVKTGKSLESIEEKGGMLVLHLAGGETVEADKALLSIGRQADLSCADSGTGPELERGKIRAGYGMETSLPGVFAAGDLNGKKMLAHAAFKMGETAAVNAAAYAGIAVEGAPVKADLRYVPSVIYCVPEAASVGLTEDEAAAEFDIAVGKFPLAANGRALAGGAPEGFVKVVADKKYGEILGVHIAGLGASEIINEAAALMAMEVTVHEVSEIVHGHPSVSEAFMEAAADCLGRCIHLPPSKK